MKLTQEQQKKVEQNMRLVGKVIKDKVHGTNQLGIYSYDDIVQIGYIGLCKAAYTDKGGCFSTYAYRLIWHEISDALIRANRLGDREDAHFSSFSESLEIENAISNAETSATEIIQKGIQALRMSTDGYNSYEIGEVLHTSPGKVRVWMSRARKYLKSQPEIVRLAGTYDIG